MAQNQFSMDLNLKAYPNQLTPDVDDDYTVRVDTQSTPLNLDDIARAAAGRLGDEEVKVKAALQVGMEVMAQAVASGFCVSTPLCYAQPMASGVVMEHELSLPVDREKIRVYASFRQGTAMTEALKNAKLRLYLQPAATGPYIAGMTSAYTEQKEKNGVLTDVPLPMAAGDMAVITGDNLKVVGTDPAVGITLTSVDNPGTSFHIPAAKISPNTPKKLQFNLPAGITDGAWTLTVTTQFAGGNYRTNEPRSFTLNKPVYIGAAPETGSETGEGSDDGEGGSPL